MGSLFFTLSDISGMLQFGCFFLLFLSHSVIDFLVCFGSLCCCMTHCQPVINFQTELKDNVMRCLETSQNQHPSQSLWFTQMQLLQVRFMKIGHNRLEAPAVVSIIFDMVWIPLAFTEAENQIFCNMPSIDVVFSFVPQCWWVHKTRSSKTL